MHTQCGTCGKQFVTNPINALLHHTAKLHSARLLVRTYETSEPTPIEWHTLRCMVCGRDFQRTALQYRTLIFNLRRNKTARIVCSQSCANTRGTK